jgi:hypothetical protein
MLIIKEQLGEVQSLDGCQFWLVLPRSSGLSTGFAPNRHDMRMVVPSPARCIARKGRAVWALVLSAKKRAGAVYHTKLVQRSLLILCDACDRAVEKLYYSAGALAGTIEGLWRALRWAHATEPAAMTSKQRLAMIPYGTCYLIIVRYMIIDQGMQAEGSLHAGIPAQGAMACRQRAPLACRSCAATYCTSSGSAKTWESPIRYAHFDFRPATPMYPFRLSNTAAGSHLQLHFRQPDFRPGEPGPS